MTKTKSHWFRMVYIEVQDKKTQVRDGKKMSYKLFCSIGTRSIESRMSAKNQQTQKAHNLTV